MRAPDRFFLEKHGSQWRVQIRVPAKLVEIIGRTKLVVPLHTDSLAIANRDKHRHIHALKERLRQAEVELRRRSKAPSVDPLVAEAMDWRAALAASDGGPYDPVQGALSDRLDELERAEGRGRAGMLSLVATGRGTPIAALIDDWLAEKDMKVRQKLDYRRAVSKFEAWLLRSGKPSTVEAITKTIAGEYKTAAFVRTGANAKTANKDISALSTFWRWLEPRGLATENVWRGQGLPKPKRSSTGSGGARKRPYSDAEVASLFAGAPAGWLLDAMTILALSGMRAEEAASMRVGDIRLDHPIPHVDLKGTKTAAAERLVPLHRDALAIIRRRVEGKAAGDYLFNELPTPPRGSAMERSQPLSKAFTRLRRAIGGSLDEREEGSRQANTDLHSLRRWFVWSAREALLRGTGRGYSPWTIAEVVGHSKGEVGLEMTMARYAGDESLEAKTACVMAVRLPYLPTGAQPK
jgi:integrase